MPWSAVKTLQNEGTTYGPGDVIGGVEGWPTFRSLKNLGWIEFRDAGQAQQANGNGNGTVDPVPVDDPETDPGRESAQADDLPGTDPQAPQAPAAGRTGKDNEPPKSTAQGRSGGRRRKG